MKTWLTYLKKDGWLLAALLFCTALCLLLGAQGSRELTGEARISQVLSGIEGAGSVDVVLCYTGEVPCGAVVVAQGAGDIAVQLRLASAVSTLLGIPQDRIAVYKREDAQ